MEFNIINRPHLHSTIVCISSQEMTSEGLTTWPIELTKIGSVGANSQEMGQIMTIKELKVIIVTIRDNDLLILGVKGNSPSIVEFSICRSFLQVSNVA